MVSAVACALWLENQEKEAPAGGMLTGAKGQTVAASLAGASMTASVADSAAQRPCLTALV